MVERKDKIIPVDFDAVYFEITSRVSEIGTVGNIEDWRKAFPEAPFEEVDAVTRKEIDWPKRSIEEKIFYVAYMKDPQAVGVDYTLEIEEMQLRRRIEDSEQIWSMWMAGCFTGEKTLDETAIRALLWYVDDSELTRKLIEDMDLEGVRLVKMSITVAPI